MGAPLVLPTDDFFPDRVTPDAAGAEVLARRLLGFAGLGELGVKVATYASHKRRSGHHTAAFFLGIEDGACLFGFDENLFESPDKAVGTLAHEVAHAFREARSLVVDDREREELLTDLTTIYLGLGVLTANAAYQYSSYRVLGGSAYEHSKMGYLPFQAMAFALAVHAVVRGEELGRVERHLSRSQADSFNAAVRALKEKPLLAGQLGVSKTAAQAPRLAVSAAPLPAQTEKAAPAALTAYAEAHDEPQPGAENRGRVVKSYFESRAFAWSVCSAMLALVAALPFANGRYIGFSVLAAACAFVGGMRLFRSRGVYRCSSCDCPLDGPEGVCSGCRA
jgi:hypothetical protein